MTFRMPFPPGFSTPGAFAFNQCPYSSGLRIPKVATTFWIKNIRYIRSWEHTTLYGFAHTFLLDLNISVSHLFAHLFFDFHAVHKALSSRKKCAWASFPARLSPFYLRCLWFLLRVASYHTRLDRSFIMTKRDSQFADPSYSEHGVA